MKRNLQITERGKQVVASLDFALVIKKHLAELHAEGTSDIRGEATALALIAWALAGRDINQPPQGDELIALADFINTHSTQIEAAADGCLATLVKHDCGSTVN